MWMSECISPRPSGLFESVVESERCGRAIEHRGWWMGLWMQGQGRRWECKFGGKKKRQLFSGRVESQAWLQHTALPVFIPSTMLWLLTSFKAANEPAHSSSHSFAPPPWRFGSPFSLPPLHLHLLFIPSFLWLLLIPEFSYLHFFFHWPFFSSLPVAQRGVGSDQGLQVSIVTLCVLVSLVLTMCSSARLSWHRACLLFTANLDHSLRDVCLCVTSQLSMSAYFTFRRE